MQLRTVPPNRDMIFKGVTMGKKILADVIEVQKEKCG